MVLVLDCGQKKRAEEKKKGPYGFIRSRRPTPIVAPSLGLFPPRYASAAHASVFIWPFIGLCAHHSFGVTHFPSLGPRLFCSADNKHNTENKKEDAGTQILNKIAVSVVHNKSCLLLKSSILHTVNPMYIGSGNQLFPGVTFTGINSGRRALSVEINDPTHFTGDVSTMQEIQKRGLARTGYSRLRET